MKFENGQEVKFNMNDSSAEDFNVPKSIMNFLEGKIFIVDNEAVNVDEESGYYSITFFEETFSITLDAVDDSHLTLVKNKQ